MCITILLHSHICLWQFFQNGELSDNDADISENENYSDGSVKSLPQSRGCLPQITGTPPNVVLVNSSSPNSYSSESLESSLKGSNTSLNEDQSTIPRNSMGKDCRNKSLHEQPTIQPNYTLTDSVTLAQSKPEIDAASACVISKNQESPQSVQETCVVLNEEYIKSLSGISPQSKSVSLVSTCSPFFHSTPEVEKSSRSYENPLTPITIPETTPSSDHSAASPSSSSSRVGGIFSRFRDMVSPIFYPSHSSHSPCSISPNPNVAAGKTMPIHEHVSKSSSSPSSCVITENNQVNCDSDEVEQVKMQRAFKNDRLLSECSLSTKNDPSIADKKIVSANTIPTKETLNSLPKKTEEYKNISGEGSSAESVDVNIQSLVNVALGSKTTSTTVVVEEKEQQNTKPSLKWIEDKLLLSSDEEQISSFMGDQSRSSQEMSPKKNDVNSRHPLVYWHENKNYIWIHIKLASLTKSQYKFTCDAGSFEFR